MHIYIYIYIYICMNGFYAKSLLVTILNKFEVICFSTQLNGFKLLSS